MSIAAALAELAAADPDAPQITDGQGTACRAEVAERTNALARAYAAAGVGRGDMVTIALPNGRPFVEACIAAWKLGATPQPVSSALPAAELAAIVELAAPRLVVDRELDTTGFSTEPLADVVSPEWKAPTSGGSTGRPKLIVSTLPGLVDPKVPAVPYMGVGDTQLVPGPLYHNGPFIYAMRGLTTGHHLVIPGRFDAENTLRLLAWHQVNWVMLVPTMMLRIWRLPEQVRAAYDLSALRMVLHLAAPCPRWLKAAWIDWLGPDRIWELYAGTEQTGLTLIGGRDWLTHPGSVGRPALGSQIRVLRPDGSQAAPGEVGEVYLLPAGGPGSTYRYVGAEPRRTADGWESLGDLGYLDEQGYLFLADRSADLILSGGANVYPAEVEAALESHPAVRSACVLGLPDEDLGERVHALVDASGPVSAEDLRKHLADRLVRYKTPRTFEFVTAPLRDEAGKVRRSALRAERISSAAADRPPQGQR